MVKNPNDQVMLVYEKVGKDGTNAIPASISFAFQGTAYVLKQGEKVKVTQGAVDHLMKRMERWEGQPANVKISVKELVIKEEEKPSQSFGGK